MQLRRGGGEDLRAVTVQRRIDPFCVDDALGGLSLGAVRHHLPIPAFGVDRTRRPQVENSDTTGSEAPASVHPVGR